MTAPAGQPALDELTQALWPRPELAAALESLIRASGSVQAVRMPTEPPSDDQHLDEWLVRAGSGANREIEPVAVTYAEIFDFLNHAAPALIALPDREGAVLAVIGRRGDRLRCLKPGSGFLWLSTAAVLDALLEPLERSHRGGIAPLLDAMDLASDRRDRAEEALLGEMLGTRRIRCGWLVRPAAAAPLAAHLRDSAIGKTAAVAFGAEAMVQLLMVLSWLTIGDLALLGHFEWGWLDAWSLILLSTIPFHLVAIWAEGVLAIRLGILFRRRLLAGTLRLRPEEVRTRGAGQFMTMAMEADVLELVSLAGGLLALMSALRLAAALWVLALGAGGLAAAALLLGWLALAIWLVHKLWRVATGWAASYRLLTNDLIERMVGHRTRLAQEWPERWHEEEDALLETYWRQGLALDRVSVIMEGAMARGWMVLGLIGFGIGLAGNGGDPVSLALCLLGVLLASQAFQILGQATPTLVQLAVAWREIGPLFEAAGRQEGSAHGPVPPVAAAPGVPVMRTAKVGFVWREGGRRILEGCDLVIHSGDRLLVEGPSGGGKTTLAAVLSGLRLPTDGLLQLHGVDRTGVGDRDWHRAVLMVPQFHENHIFTGTFAFNLLMGRGWPPLPRDLAEAEALCEALGLGPLLARMPAGFQQMVGESGWILSHGERSRVFIARALLQKPDMMILDESFAALDPETLERSLDCVLARVRTLMVIAHP